MENNLLELIKLKSTVYGIQFIDKQEFIDNIDNFQSSGEYYIIHPKHIIPILVKQYSISDYYKIYYHGESKMVINEYKQTFSKLEDCISECRRILSNKLKVKQEELRQVQLTIDSINDSFNTIYKIENEL
jgi:hypothetical protein